MSDATEQPIASLAASCTLEVPVGRPETQTTAACGMPASSGVVDPGTGETHLRCPFHRGRLQDGSTGEVVTTVRLAPPT